VLASEGRAEEAELRDRVVDLAAGPVHCLGEIGFAPVFHDRDGGKYTPGQD
jgi:hypothetical protein